MADLQPNEIGILAMRHSDESRRVAEHYAEAREIPASQICYLEATPGPTLGRGEWERSVRPAIRRWIGEQDLQSKLKCLVTVWGVPLRIGGVDESSPQVTGRVNYLIGERQARLGRLEALIDEFDSPTQAKRGLDWPADVKIDVVRQKLEQVMNAVRRKSAKAGNAAVRREADAAMGNAVAAAGGLASVVEALTRQGKAGRGADADRGGSIETVKARLAGLQEGKAALEQLPETVERDQQILAIVERMAGLLGSIQWIDTQLELLSKNETAASFDSELSLLYWPNYPLLRWQPNVLHYGYDDSYQRWLRTTLMVSRLEAPTIELTLGLIDKAIEVERRGLSGKVYLDARSSAKRTGETKRGAYAEYDRSLANLAGVLQSHSSLEVRIDKKQELFQAGDCPDAALYCGWYSLRKYVDAFDWNAGAVGYHIASAEATTLRDSKSNAWCKRMLEDGVCATLGPTFEPYLAAFPKPEEFFVLIASGRYTLVESYYRCKPFNSWAMVLVGDPLYNPYRAQPQFEDGGLPASVRQLLE